LTLPMRTFRRLLQSAPLLALAVCGKVDNFDAQQTASATIDGSVSVGSLAGDLGFASLNSVDLKTTPEFQSQGLSDGDIASVKVQQLILTVTSPASGQDLSFVQSVRFFIEAPNVSKTEIANGGTFTSGVTSVALSLDDVELSPT
jgi:hypothetical protein